MRISRLTSPEARNVNGGANFFLKLGFGGGLAEAGATAASHSPWMAAAFIGTPTGVCLALGLSGKIASRIIERDFINARRN